MTDHYITRTRYAWRRVLAVALVFALLWGAGTVYARAVRGMQRVPLAYVHSAIIVCEGWAEDSAAHLRLVSFDRTHAVYVCRRNGY